MSIDLLICSLDLVNFKPISSFELLKQIVEKQTVYAEEKKVYISIHEDDSAPNILGDYDSLERAFGAIINNAIKFCVGGGNVNVRIEL